MQSLFEGSMYTFVFLWTPALRWGGWVGALQGGKRLWLPLAPRVGARCPAISLRCRPLRPG